MMKQLVPFFTAVLLFGMSCSVRAQEYDAYHKTVPFDLIPKEFHGAWEFAYYFGASKILDTKEQLGKTITITP
ncbi:MAG: hypothetical protein ACE5EM_11505, partial [Sphingomonadales bacterium]